MTDFDPLAKRVSDAWNNAREGGYENMRAWPLEDIAGDMCAYDADLENETIEAITAELRTLLGRDE